MSDLTVTPPQHTNWFPAAMITLTLGSLMALAYWVGALLAHTAGG